MCPLIGVNYGRVGFLTAIPGDDSRTACSASSPATTATIELSTLEVTVNGETRTAVNDVVVAGGTLGRMIEVGYSIGGEDLGSQPCDGLICATPAGSTAYNLSNGGPVLVWGLDAMVLTFVAPHALAHPAARRPARADVVVTNLSPDSTRPSSSTASRSARSPAASRRSSAGSEPARHAARGDVLPRYAATFGR